ncbi:SDR family oxidoreductase [Nocardioides marinquilinus]|uniref:SDR family oxidoreductase n=1 Tax=Nocardioides marinquilinus TaxID=1210400 RepID=A0ABP9PHQ6_9ACTN
MRVVAVVGGTSGIGLAVARMLSEDGVALGLVARDAGRLADVAARLPGPVTTAVADVVDGPAVQAALDHVVATHGRLDAVVTTAQAMAYGRVEDVPPEVLGHAADVAIDGTANLARSALPHLRASGGGSLVVVSSLLAEISVPAMGSYCASKWGQLGLVRALQVETQRERGIHVSLVLPGAIDTPIYHLAGSYAGSAGSAPPPVVSPDAVARACVRCLDRPRRMVHVGPVNRLAVTGFRFLPAVYDRVAGPMVDRIVLRGPAMADGPGNVLEPDPAGEGLRGGWTLTGRLRRPGDRRARWRRR